MTDPVDQRPTTESGETEPVSGPGGESPDPDFGEDDPRNGDLRRQSLLTGAAGQVDGELVDEGPIGRRVAFRVRNGHQGYRIERVAGTGRMGSMYLTKNRPCRAATH